MLMLSIFTKYSQELENMHLALCLVNTSHTRHKPLLALYQHLFAALVPIHHPLMVTYTLCLHVVHYTVTAYATNDTREVTKQPSPLTGGRFCQSEHIRGQPAL